MRYLYNIVDCSKDLKEFEFFLLDKYMTEKEIQIFFKNDNYRILQVKPIPDEMLDPKFKEELKMTFQQVESEALASKVVFPSDSMISYAAATSEAIADKNNETWNYPICFIKGAQWLRSQITLAPKGQVTSECKLQGHKGGWDENGNAYCTTCDGSAPNEPEVKAQGFEEFFNENRRFVDCNDPRTIAEESWKAALNSKMYLPLGGGEPKYISALSGANAACGEFEDWWSDYTKNWDEDLKLTEINTAKAAFLAGQKSKAATLPDAVYVGLVGDKYGGEPDLEKWIMQEFRNKRHKQKYRVEFYAVKSMNEG